MSMTFSQRVKQLRKDEDGFATLEALIWIPIFVFFLVFILDTTFIFFGKAQALRFIQDGNRALSVGALPDVDATALQIKTAISDYAPAATVNTEILNGMIISTTMTIPVSDLMIIGTIPVFKGTNVEITATHFLEQ